jgi:ATP-dependent Clp protease ATP-binding subunit ClpA
LAAVRGIEVEAGPEVVAWLTARVSESGQGARAVRRTVERLDTALADRLSEPPRGRLVVTVPAGGAALEAHWAVESLAGAPDARNGA